MKIWVATNNQGKLAEFQRLFPDHELHAQSEIASFSPRPEDGKDFYENALIKVKTLAAVKNEDWVIGEDSGLEVTGLGNLPGIHSARYAGEQASDAENTAKLLKMMQIRCNLQREARFRCVLVARNPAGEIQQFEGVISGKIATKQSGTEGFGYDNVFIPEGEEKTFAELGVAFKLSRSHRAEAVKKFLEALS